MHVPVLEKEIVEAFGYLGELDSPVFVDGTLGAGGHSVRIAESQKLTHSTGSGQAVKSQGEALRIVGIDKDSEALKIAKKNIEAVGLSHNFILIHNDFKNITTVLESLGIERTDGALLDLGVSSMQLDGKERGFSFQDPNQPLDMRMDQNQAKTAEEVVNSYPEKELKRIIFEFGEERFAGKIARMIIQERKTTRIETVGQLVDIIIRSMPRPAGRLSRIHPATRTFQALRIEVNEELAGLNKAIEQYAGFLSHGGKLAIISFHSLEDRIVKQTFVKLANPCTCPPKMPCVCGKKPEIRIMTKKPILPDDTEIRANPRSRSAKLRILEKI